MKKFEVDLYTMNRNPITVDANSEEEAYDKAYDIFVGSQKFDSDNMEMSNQFNIRQIEPERKKMRMSEFARLVRIIDENAEITVVDGPGTSLSYMVYFSIEAVDVE